MRVVIVKLGAAGDILRTSAILPSLMRRWPRARIDWITRRSMVPLIEGNPLLNSIMTVEDIVPEGSYDLVISMDDEPDAVRLATRLHGKRLVGAYERRGAPTYSSDSAPWFDMGLLSKLGLRNANRLKSQNRSTYQHIWCEILGASFDGSRPHLAVSPQDKAWARETLRAAGVRPRQTLIGLNSGSGKRWWDKRLPISDTIDLIKILQRTNPTSKILLLGGQDETDRTREIRRGVPGVISVPQDHSIGRFAALIRECKTVITSDSLALHVATAMKRPVVAFFAPTSPWEVEVYGDGARILPTHGCVACYRNECEIPPVFDLDGIADAVRHT